MIYLLWFIRLTILHAALAIIHGRHVELILVPIEVDVARVEPDDAGVGLDPEQARRLLAADKAEGDAVAVLVAGHHCGDQGVRASVFVHVGRVDLLREPGLFVVLVLGVDADGGRTGPCRFALVLGRHLEYK